MIRLQLYYLKLNTTDFKRIKRLPKTKIKIKIEIEMFLISRYRKSSTNYKVAPFKKKKESYDGRYYSWTENIVIKRKKKKSG